MTSEEKRVIESVKEEYKKGIEQGNVLFPIFLNQAKIILSLIEKQSKEIEESEQKERKAYIDGTNVAHELCNKKWKDKIKAKIEEVNAEELNLAFIISGVEYKEAITSALQSLLDKE